MAKLFAKSFRRSRLFEKRRHPETFVILSGGCFRTLSPMLTKAASLMRGAFRDRLSALTVTGPMPQRPAASGHRDKCPACFPVPTCCHPERCGHDP
ncbi:hypothetical protein NJLHNGOC_11475 [Novacetimonas cocois]|uniref:Uncharacterized protein n=1 Tax=Novacetimonas cocois TaxID=1747507 RepID=A0A365YSW2_9PROT|nr:hypothetical protein NJLHNGOC_11475 [Novacetimonas cocois]